MVGAESRPRKSRGRPLSLPVALLERASRMVCSVTAPFNPAAATFGNSSTLGFFPVPAVKEAGGLQARPVDAVEATRVHGDPVRLRARHIKSVQPAMRTECVLRHAGAECVDRVRVLVLQQFELLRRGRGVRDALLYADRAVAL